MSNLMMYVGSYILILITIALTVGFAFALIIGRSIAIKHKAFDKEFDAMKRRIDKRRELNGRATKHEVDLAAKEERGGWTGDFTSSCSIKSSLSEPHPFYNKEADDEQGNS